MSYPAALWFICLLESQIFQFLCPVVQTGSQQWSLELGMLPGEYEPGQVKLQSEEFLRKAAKDGWNWVKFSECWFQVQLENYISSLPCFPIYWKLLTKRQKWRTNQQVVEGWEDTKEQSLENFVSFGWKKNTKPESMRRGRRNVGSLLWAGNPGGRGSLSRCKDDLWRQWKDKEELQRGFGIGSWISKCSSAPCCEFPVLCLSPPHSWSREGNSAMGTPEAAGGAGLVPGRQINLLSFNFCPELNQ